MASTILSDNGVSSGSAGLKSTADSTGVLALQTTTSGGAATTALTIDTSQNVGIGTSSPSAKLDVRNGANVLTTDSNTSPLSLMRTTLYNGNLKTGAIHTTAPCWLYRGPTSFSGDG